jgi:glycosyltransferase involved in cell wall biosynthesis
MTATSPACPVSAPLRSSPTFMAERRHPDAPEARASKRLAILIPVFNDQAGLERALESLAADGEEFTVYVVDDGSNPPMSIPDGLPYRVHLIRQEPNQGITAALNLGLAQIAADGYDYIARLDAGDLSLPGRLAAQAAFLDDHPEHALVGTATRQVDVSGRVLYDYHPPAEHRNVVRGLRYQAALVHPSIMLRLEAVQACGMYDNRFPGGEDYDLFFRLAKTYKLANLQSVYVVKEINPSSITSRRRERQLGRLRLLAWHFDHRSVHSYLGIVANALAVVVPRRLIFGLRRWRNSFRPRSVSGSNRSEGIK